jgi:hypothetical protein
MPRDDRSRRPAKSRSDVLAEIYDIVEGREAAPEAEADTGPKFRAQALRQLDVPGTLDNLLQLTSRRTWLAIVGIALAIVAGLIYAGNTVRVESVAAQGRAVAPPGIINAASPTDGVITSVLRTEGELVAAGQPVATGRSADGSDLAVISPLPGTAWQQIAAAGAVVSLGTVVTQLLPPDSGSLLMLQVPEAQAGPIALDQAVNLRFGAGGTATGRVTAIDTAPMPSAVADTSLAMSTPYDEGPVVMVTVTADTEVPPGDAIAAEVIQSERTLLESLLGLG